LDQAKEIHFKVLREDGGFDWYKWTNVMEPEIVHYAGQDGELYKRNDVVEVKVVVVSKNVERHWKR
jgi:hypothetical protein